MITVSVPTFGRRSQPLPSQAQPGHAQTGHVGAAGQAPHESLAELISGGSPITAAGAVRGWPAPT